MLDLSRRPNEIRAANWTVSYLSPIGLDSYLAGKKWRSLGLIMIGKLNVDYSYSWSNYHEKG